MSTRALPGEGRRASRLLGAGVAVVVGASVVAAVEVGPGSQAILHGLVACVVLLAMRIPDHRLARAGQALSLLRIGAWLGVAAGLALLPLPAEMIAWMAPGTSAIEGQTSWLPSAVSVELTLLGLAELGLLWGVLGVTAVWAGSTRLSKRVEDPVITLTLIVTFCALAHAAMGQTALFGLWPSGATGLYLAPFVNPNHAGALLLLALPTLVGRILDGPRERPRELPYAILALTGSLLVVALARSPGLMGAMIVMTLAAWWSARPTLGRGVAAVWIGASLALPVLWVWNRLVETSWSAAQEVRWLALNDLPALVEQHAFFGVGVGAFDVGFAPFRTFGGPFWFHDLHNDWLQWLAEVGIVGGVVTAWAVWRLLRLHRGEATVRGRRLELGLLGVLVHSVVDFPLQILGISVAFTAVIALRWSAFVRRDVAPRALREALGLVLLAQLVGGVIALRAERVEHASAAVLEGTQGSEEVLAAVQSLERWSPGHATIGLHEAWQHERAGRHSAAGEAALRVVRAHPAEPEALRRAALVLGRAGYRSDAVAAAEQATRRDAVDYRSWAVRSQLTQDPMASAIFWARALRGWPYRPDEVGQPLLQGLERWPMGIWWLESLADAPAYWSDQLGHWALAEDDPYLALLAWEQAERIRPDLYAWWFPRARALAALERYDEADALLQGATERKPKSSAIWATWGDLLRDQGRYDEARQRYINGWRSQATRVDLLARAIRMAGRQDAREGLDFVRRLELSGQLPRTLVVDIACARLFHEAGELTNCRDRLAPHVDDDDEAQLLWDQCAILDPMEGL